MFMRSPLPKSVCLLPQVACATLAALLAGAFGSEIADARDYSLHISAHVPKVCATRALASQVEADAAEHDIHGTIRISCNVNYALSFSRVGSRYSVSPVANLGDDFSLSFVTQGIDGTAIEATCATGDLRSGAICEAVSAPQDARIAKPRAIARLRLAHSGADSSTAMRPTMNDAVGVTNVEPRVGIGHPRPVGSLRMMISARI